MYIYIHIYSTISAVTWQIVHEHIVIEAFRSKLFLLMNSKHHKRDVILNSCHSTAYG